MFLKINYWLCWVLVAARKLSLVVTSEGYSLVVMCSLLIAVVQSLSCYPRKYFLYISFYVILQKNSLIGFFQFTDCSSVLTILPLCAFTDLKKKIPSTKTFISMFSTGLFYGVVASRNSLGL